MVDENHTIKQACEASDAGETAVKRWRQQYLAELAGKPLPNAQPLIPGQREIQYTKQCIRQLGTEKDILKKPAPFMPFMLRGCRECLCQGNGMGYSPVDELKIPTGQGAPLAPASARQGGAYKNPPDLR